MCDIITGGLYVPCMARYGGTRAPGHLRRVEARTLERSARRLTLRRLIPAQKGHEDAVQDECHACHRVWTIDEPPFFEPRGQTSERRAAEGPQESAGRRALRVPGDGRTGSRARADPGAPALAPAARPASAAARQERHVARPGRSARAQEAESGQQEGGVPVPERLLRTQDGPDRDPERHGLLEGRRSSRVPDLTGAADLEPPRSRRVFDFTKRRASSLSQRDAAGTKTHQLHRLRERPAHTCT